MPPHPHIAIMLGTNAGVGTQDGNLSANQDTPIIGTSTGVLTLTPLLPVVTSLSFPDFNYLSNDPLLHDPTWP